MSTPLKILVVDDHIDLAENIAEILAVAGHDTLVADSAEAALERLAVGDIAAVITDFRLPGRSGAELIAELRRRKSAIPAIVMSAYTDDDTIESSRRAGAFEVLPKPVQIGRLMALVDDLGRDALTILLVEDNIALADNIAEALRGAGYDVTVSTNATEAMTTPLRLRAAILDYRLPDGDGVLVAERISSRDPRTRILFVSAYTAELTQKIAGSLSDADTLEKPVDPRDLLSWLAKAVGPRVGGQG